MSLSAPGKPRVLYIVYWGAAEPLGQSLVLPAIRKLADLGVELTLVTFEKRADLSRHEEMAGIRASLDIHGVEWIPLRYHKRPKIPATAFDALQGIAISLAKRLRFQPDIIHARTFIGGLIGLALAPMLNAKLIYHNEGYYPDEQVDAGIWRAGSTPHRVAKYLESKLYARSDGIIALSQRSRAEIGSLPGVRRKVTPVIVVPSCVDLDRFGRGLSRSGSGLSAVRFVYLGSVGGRYRLSQVGRFVRVAADEFQRFHFRVLTGANPGLVEAELGGCDLSEENISVASVPHAFVPEELATQHVGLHFLHQGISEHGSSPTKIGEYWAAGLPVVVTPGMGDSDEIIRRERVGVLVKEHTRDEYHRVAVELKKLLTDPHLASRCRRVAETHYALEPACEKQVDLYRNLLMAC
jgi:glycosyltransferase involved in cell wall biosynthesis